MGDYILELKEITKRFGSLAANDHVSLRVEKASVHAIVGENGAGKSTLMNIVSAIHQPDSGEIYLNGQAVHFRDPLDAARHGIGMVYQEFQLFPELTVLENVIMGFEKKHMGSLIDYSSSKKAVMEICEKFHFNIPLHEHVDGLPVSILQQVEIVKVLYRGANIIILDEPTSVLTPQGIEGLFDAVRFLKSVGVTIIIITHKLKEVFAIADAITVLKNGRVSGSVLPSDIDEKALAKLMVGREVLLTAEKPQKKTGESVLTVTNLNVTDENGVKRVAEVNLDLKSGQIIGIAGIAGSGQEQLIASVVGTQKADQGSRILFMGKDVTDAAICERRKMGMGYVPQDRILQGINKKSSIWENAIMGYHISQGFKSRRFLNRSEINAYTDAVVEKYLVKRQSNYDGILSLSGGNIQKLIIGREFLQAGKLLVLEDPTRGVDIGAIEFIWKKIVEIAASGVAVLMVSHELDEVIQISDHIYVMFNGRLYEGGASGEYDKVQLGLAMSGEGKRV